MNPSKDETGMEEQTMKVETIDINWLRRATKIAVNRRNADGYARHDRYVNAEEALELIANGYVAHAGETGFINMNTLKMRSVGYRVDLYPPK